MLNEIVVQRLTYRELVRRANRTDTTRHGQQGIHVLIVNCSDVGISIQHTTEQLDGVCRQFIHDTVNGDRIRIGLVVVENDVRNVVLLNLGLPCHCIVHSSCILTQRGIDAQNDDRNRKIVGHKLRQHRRDAAAGTAASGGSDQNILNGVVRIDVLDRLVRHLAVRAALEDTLAQAPILAGTVLSLFVLTSFLICLQRNDVDIRGQIVHCPFRRVVRNDLGHGDLGLDQRSDVTTTIAAADHQKVPNLLVGAVRDARGHYAISFLHESFDFLVGQFHFVCHFCLPPVLFTSLSNMWQQ